MTLRVEKSGQACGAILTGVDLSQELDSETIKAIREAWVENKVVAFPDQNMSDDDLERFSLYLGTFAGDPYIAPMEGRENIIELKRSANEKAPLFAKNR